MRELLALLPIAALVLAVVPAYGQAAALARPGAMVWGDAHYQVVADDSTGSDPTAWGIAQEAGLTMNLRTGGGLEFLGEFLLPFDSVQNLSPSALVPQLFVRASLADGLSLTAGIQRLNWGTAKVFSAIDTLEIRANPLDVRSVLTGVTGFKADLIPSDRVSVSLVALPGPDLRWSRAAVRFELVEEELGLDLGFGAVKYTYFDRKVPAGADPIRLDDAALLSDGALSLGPLVLYEELQVRGGRDTGYLLPGMPAFDDLGGRDQAVFRGVGGMMVQLDLGLTRPASLVIEYLYNGDGFSTEEARQFASRYASWQGAGSPGGAQVPAAFAGLGGFRRHYVSAALIGIAVSRSLLLDVTGILGVDSLLTQFAVALTWEVSPSTSIELRYDVCHAFLDPGDQPTELLVIPFRNRLALSFSTSFE